MCCSRVDELVGSMHWATDSDIVYRGSQAQVQVAATVEVGVVGIGEGGGGGCVNQNVRKEYWFEFWMRWDCVR